MQGGEADANRDDLAILAAILFVVFVNLCAWSMLADGDTSWHIAAGNWMLANHAVPAADPFSFTHAGDPWLAHEWLSEVLMAMAWQAGSWSGLSLLFAVAGTLLFLVQGRYMQRWLPPLAVFMGLLAEFLVLQPFLLARPHMLAWPLLAIWTIALLRAREQHQAPPLAFALLMLIWANIHGSFLFGILLIGPFALEALISEKERRAALLGWGRFALLAVIAGCFTPHGPAGLLFPLQLSTMSTLPMIREWQPTSLTQPGAFLILLIGGLGLAFRRGVRLPPLRALLLLLLVVLALSHIRHQTICAVIATLLLAEPVAATLRGAATPRPQIQPRRRQVLAFCLLLATIGGVRLAISIHRADTAATPGAAIAHIPPGLRLTPGFNNYDFGGALILAGIRPFIDGRADLYGDEFMRGYARIARGDKQLFDAAATQWGIGWALLAPDDGLRTALGEDQNWRILYQDRHAVLFVRREK